MKTQIVPVVQHLIMPWQRRIGAKDPPECGLDFELLLYGCISHLSSVPLHLCSRPESAFQPSGCILHVF